MAGEFQLALEMHLRRQELDRQIDAKISAALELGEAARLTETAVDIINLKLDHLRWKLEAWGSDSPFAESDKHNIKEHEVIMGAAQGKEYELLGEYAEAQAACSEDFTHREWAANNPELLRKEQLRGEFWRWVEESVRG